MTTCRLRLKGYPDLHYKGMLLGVQIVITTISFQLEAKDFTVLKCRTVAHQNWRCLLPLHDLSVRCESTPSSSNAPCGDHRLLPPGQCGSRGRERRDAHTGHDVGVPSASPLPRVGMGVVRRCGHHGGHTWIWRIKCQQSPLSETKPNSNASTIN